MGTVDGIGAALHGKASVSGTVEEGTTRRLASARASRPPKRLTEPKSDVSGVLTRAKLTNDASPATAAVGHAINEEGDTLGAGDEY